MNQLLVFFNTYYTLAFTFKSLFRKTKIFLVNLTANKVEAQLVGGYAAASAP